MLANYHTHTPRCMHATGSEEEYVQNALSGGFEILGFSDHCPWNYASGYTATMRMLPGQMPDYCGAVRRLRKKYSNQMRIYLGLECEYFPRYLDWQQENAREYGLDYLILGNHFHLSDEDGIYFAKVTQPRQLLEYTKTTIEGMETGLFACLAHPDLALNWYPAWDDACQELCERICEAALRLDMPLEYNVLGKLRRAELDGTALGYTTPQFWRIAAQKGCKAIIGQDAHRPDALASSAAFTEARHYLEGLGVPVLETLPGLGV